MNRECVEKVRTSSNSEPYLIFYSASFQDFMIKSFVGVPDLNASKLVMEVGFFRFDDLTYNETLVMVIIKRIVVCKLKYKYYIS